ncbi:MAG: glycosyltransferase family 4 protein [Bacteroidetes bacterium]|nr:glycosyltransferase family 4 protein [Bacteroidota bacterium]
MKILQLCQRPPFPPIDGGAIGMNNVTMGLLELGHEVKVLTIATDKHPVQLTKIPKDYLEKTSFESVHIDTSIRVKDAFFNLFDDDSYNIKRFISVDFENKLIEIFAKKNYDIVLMESLYVTPYIDTIRKHSKAKIVLRSPNVEYKIWERVTKNTVNPLKKPYLSVLTKRLKAYEKSILPLLDGLIPVTKEDLDIFRHLGYDGKGFSVPTGIITNSNPPASIAEEEKSVFHIASMNWMPNVEAVEWFLKNVWDLVLKEIPDAKFYLAGRDMPQSLLQHKQKNVSVVGEVPDAKTFYASKKIMVVPILSGSGMRVKIVEGMAMGKVIVSTKIGAEGIFYTPNKNILIADTPEEFADQIIFCLRHPEFCNDLSREAKELIEKEYDNIAICKKISSFLEAL